MKILVLAALVAAVASGRLSSQEVDSQWEGPWRSGNLYRYDVDAFTLARLQEGASSGSAFQARFVVRATAPDRLVARLENPRHAQVHQELPENRQLPSGLSYQPVDKLDQPFEIIVHGGRVISLNLPSNLPLAQENLLKGLIGALQVDLSAHRHVRRDENGFEKQTQQGQFKKMETDVTGDCETVYNVYPAVPEWRRELPNFAKEEEPIMISKTKDYGHCHHRVAYHFGVPQGSEWAGTAHRNHEEQFIRRATVSRILSGKQGPIYKSETTSTVHVNPQMYGKDKAEVLSYVQLKLVSYGQDSEPEWQKPENSRVVKNLLYSITQKQVTIRDRSSSSSSESNEHSYQSQEQGSNIEQGNQESQESNRRMRRSVKSPRVAGIRQSEWQDNWAASSSKSSSESDSASLFVNDDIPRYNEPAYAALYMTPQSRADKKQNPINAQKLIQEIAQLLQNPNNMPKGDFLSKFNVLVRIIASMSSEQLALTSRNIEVAKSSNNKVKADMWMIYRDAVTQAGTMPAFHQIQAWIQNKKVQGEEAAQILATLVKTLRYPTKDIMLQFFKLAMSDEVRQQKYLNNTALIAATRFINMGQINNETAHSYYPTHMYGRLSRRHDAFVLEKVLPRLSQELKQSIQDGDSNKAQVFIKAIGNLGHEGILQVFAPYLEGKIPTTTYLRTQMVKNLQVLAHQKNAHARAVLFAILKNIAEQYELRIAAIDNIFMARPTTAMMQAMAQMTHNDPSVQVRAVLKSAILSAAELKNPHYWDLARTARAAKWMVTKQEYGKQYSNKYLDDHNDMESDLGILTAFSNIGSEDSVFPKFLKWSVKSKSQGWDQENTISTSFSSVQKFVNAVQQQLTKVRRSQQDSENHQKYTAEKISQMLNIKHDSQNPLEAALLVAIMGQERYFTFSESDLQQLPSIISEYYSRLAKGAESHYTKVINQNQVSIMFPVGMGMPFIYKYKQPTVVHFEAKGKGQIIPPSEENQSFSANIDKEIQFTFARNIDGSVGFMDTLTNQYASVGVVSKLQLHVPVKMHLQMKSGELKIQMEPLRADQDNTILHFSVWPYSANQKKDSLVTVSLDPSTKAITRNNKVVSLDSRFGQSVGNQFQLQGYSYSTDYKNLGNMIQSKDVLTNIANALYQKDVALTHFNFRQLGKQSPNKRITLTATFDKFYNQKQPAQPLVASNVEQITPNNEERRKEMVKRVAAGINSATVNVFDVSATYEGAQKHEFVLTAAMGHSQVDSKVQYALFAARNSAQLGNSQVNAVASVNKPAVKSLNFLDALDQELKMNFEADIKYAQNSNINVQGRTERSQKYAEHLKNSPLGKKCAQEMAKNNNYQSACHEMILRAHAPDQLKASVTYKELTPLLRSMTYKAVKMAEYFGYWYSNNNPQKALPEGKIEIESQMFYMEDSMNLSLNSKYGDLSFKNVPIPKVSAHALAIYSPIQPQERVANFYTRHQYQPFCTVDAKKIRTFSNRSFDYTMTRSWHVVMQDDGSRQGRPEQLLVLARRPSESQQEIYISFKSQSGKDLELEIQPAPQPKGKPTLKVKTNGKKVAEGDMNIYWDEAQDQPLVQYYTQRDGVLMMNIQEDRFRAMYDGERLVILAQEHRNNIRGICGYMNGDARYDYLTPNGLVDKPEHFAASYALNDGETDPETQKLKSEAQTLSYPIKNHYTAILPADQEWRRARQASSEEESSERNVYKSRSYAKSSSCEIQQKIQYYEDHSQICVTTTPLPACQSNCQGEDYKVQAVEVMCRPKIDQQFRAYRDQIRQGQNPNVSGAAQKTRQFRVPAICRA